MVWGGSGDSFQCSGRDFWQILDGFRWFWRSEVALEAQGADFLVRVRPISGFWMLPLRLLVNISWIWEVAGVLLGVLGGRFGFNLGSNIEMITTTIGI